MNRWGLFFLPFFLLFLFRKGICFWAGQFKSFEIFQGILKEFGLVAVINSARSVLVLFLERL